ncbi:MAG: 5-dehydro-2-deoxygluconokinase [Pseudomonadota bacterium]|nr:5-dehydro-2-deoxygluconokinase [Pseudomonadota bacterium]
MSVPRTFDLACIGRAAVDLYGEQIGCPLEDVSTFARYLGGSPANTAVGAARLGLAAAMISRVGDEQNGRFLRATFEREGVDVSQVSTDPERLTALVFLAIRDRDDFPHVFYRDNCADMGLEAAHIDADFIARCRGVLVSGTHLSREGTRAACERAVRAARAAGSRVILDIDYRPVLWGLARHGEGAERYAASDPATSRIAGILPQCDLVVGTEEEFRIAGGSTNVIAALRAVRARTPALLVVKLGAKGCVAFPGAIASRLEGGIRSPGFPVEVFNVLGAGDAFMAGFLRGWLRDEPLERCCEYANACGAIVVSRHGCAPAMATEVELRHFLEHGPATPRLREDATLAHIHRATTRRKLHTPLHVLAFDHRGHFASLVDSHAADPARVAEFKALIAEAFQRVARNRPGAGVIVDDRYGEAILPRLTARGFWVARPVEAPNAIPLAFESGEGLGLALRAWPAEHVAKCLVYFHPDDAPGLRALQLARLATLAHACAETGRELLIEVVPPPGSAVDATTAARALEEIYASGLKPDWWKLPPNAQAAAWDAVDRTIERHDPLCHGVLVLGMEASAAKLREGFAAASRSPWVRGFAVGRSIFAPAAEQWFARAWSDARAVDDIAARYAEVIELWENKQHRETA